MKSIFGTVPGETVLVFGLIFLLVACGESSAPPAATTTAVTNAIAKTTAVTTASSPTTVTTTTPVPATTALSVTSASTTSNTTGTAASSSSAAGRNTPPASDLTEVKLDPALSNSIISTFPSSVKPEVRIYYSDDSTDKVASFLDANLISSGYKFAIPGATKPVGSAGDTIVGLYTKDGKEDFYFTISNVPASDAEIIKFFTGLENNKDVTPEVKQNFINQIKDHKSVITGLSGKGIAEALYTKTEAANTPSLTTAVPSTAVPALPSTAVPAVPSTAVPALTTASGTAPGATSPASDLTEIKADPAIINAAITKLGASSKVDLKYYTSNDEQDKVAAALDSSLIAAGYKFAFPGATSPGKTGDGSIVGLYTKEGAPDVFFGVQSTTDANVARTVGVDSFKELPAEVTQQFASQLKSQKSYSVILTGSDIVKLVVG